MICKFTHTPFVRHPVQMDLGKYSAGKVNGNQARGQDWFWGGAGPQTVHLLDLKSGLYEPHPPHTHTHTCPSIYI